MPEAALAQFHDFPDDIFHTATALRTAIDADADKSPNLSPAIRVDDTLFVSGMLADGGPSTGDPAAQTRDIVRKIDAVVAKAGFTRGDVRDLLVYVTDDEAAKAAAMECRAAFGSAAITAVKVGLADTGARVEIMSLAQRG